MNRRRAALNQIVEPLPSLRSRMASRLRDSDKFELELGPDTQARRMEGIRMEEMTMKRCLWIGFLLFIVGCAHRIADGPDLPDPAPVTDWADQLGAVLRQAADCVEAHHGDAAVVVGVRILGTGEFAIMTRGRRMELVACVHDGDRVVHQAAVAMPPGEVAALPHVTLRATESAPESRCEPVEPVFWGSSLVGWLTKRTCVTEKMNQLSETSATSVRFRREQDETLDVP